MKIETLRKLAVEARTHPHYQFRDGITGEDERVAMAQKSFQRLSDEQKLTVQKSWQKAIEANGEKLTPETALELLTLRFLCQTNLFFLCLVLEKYNQVTVRTHEEICNEFFVPKDPTQPTFEKFANAYTSLKDRMLLVPRGGFKSSLNIADCVQWTICFPKITIAILTGRYDLAGDFVGELKQHFTLDENGDLDAKSNKRALGPRKMADPETSEWSSSMFQVLFPEHCVGPNEGNMFEFQTPAGGDDKEPTVRAAGIEQALAGSHFGIIKLDDVVTDTNSQTPDQLAKICKQISVKRAMLHPYGFMDVIGTWYDDRDFYGLTIKQQEEMAKEDGLEANITGSVDSGVFNSRVHMDIYLRAAWWLSERALKEGRIEEEARKEDYDLWFPERLTYEFLKKERRSEKFPGEFAIKYLNNPRKANYVKFPRELLVRRTIPHTQLPPQGIIVSAVDTAYSTKSWADYTVMITALIYGGRFYILNMVRGRFDENDLPRVLAATGYKWKPKRIAIEDSMGVKWMAKELRREMDKLQISIPVEFVSLGYGTKARSKQIKAKPVLRLLGDERMYFMNSCEGLQEIYAEMEQFTGTGSEPHDDIVCALSLLAENFAAYADMEQRIDYVATQYAADRHSAAVHDMIYGLGRYARYNANQMDDNPVTAFETQSRMDQSPVADTYVDPFADLLA